MSEAHVAVYAALARVRTMDADISPAATLSGDLGFESIDVVDLFFELEQSTGVVIELQQLLARRRFDRLSIQDLIDYLTA